MDKPHPARRNQRCSSRQVIRRGVRVVCRQGMGPNIAVRMLDVSEGGVRMHLRSTPSVGEEVQVEMISPDGSRSTFREGQIVWVEPAADGECRAGIQFSRRLDLTSLGELGAR